DRRHGFRRYASCSLLNLPPRGKVTKQVLGRLSIITRTMEDASGHYPTTVATRTILLARKAAPRPALPDPAPGWRPARGADLGPSGRAGPPGRRLVAATGPGARQQHRDHLQELRPLDHCRPGHLDGRPHLRPAVPQPHRRLGPPDPR